MRGTKPLLYYEDIFTGIIFNKPFIEQRAIYHPYHRYAIEKEAEQKGITDSDRIRRRAINHDNEFFFKDDMNWAFTISAVNFIPVLFLHLFSVLSSLLGIIYLLWRIHHK
jgi:hypothetical protein